MKLCYKTFGHSKLKWGTQGVDHALNLSFYIYLKLLQDESKTVNFFSTWNDELGLGFQPLTHQAMP